MKPRIPGSLYRALSPLLAGAGLLATGCSLPLPQAQADTTRYFLLQPPARPAEAPGENAACVIRIERVEVPSYLLDKPMAVRRGPNEVRYLEGARWAEPLDQNLARDLGAGLNGRPGITTVPRGMQAARWDYSLRVQVSACEGGAGKDARFQATWTLTPAAGSSKTPRSGVFAAQNLTWDGSAPNSLAAALSEGVAQLCQEVAGAATAQP